MTFIRVTTMSGSDLELLPLDELSPSQYPVAMDHFDDITQYQQFAYFFLYINKKTTPID